MTNMRLSLDKVGQLIGKNTSIYHTNILVYLFRNSSITFKIYYNKNNVREIHQESGAFSKIQKI